MPSGSNQTFRFVRPTADSVAGTIVHTLKMDSTIYNEDVVNLRSLTNLKGFEWQHLKVSPYLSVS